MIAAHARENKGVKNKRLAKSGAIVLGQPARFTRIG
jgi:hypothetical protein